MILKKGLWIESNDGTKWKIIDRVEDIFTIQKDYKGFNVGTISGLTLEDIKQYFKM